MKLLALAMLLAVAGTAPAIPQKAADTSARSHQDIKQQPSTKQTPSVDSPPIPNAPSANANEHKDETPAKAGTQETIFITESAAVPVKDVWDKAYVIFAGLLVIIGALGISFAKKTLDRIERQAKANEDTLIEIRAAGEKTDRMIAHAEAQGVTARESLDLSRDTAKKQLRAYLTVAEAMLRFNTAWIAEPQVHIQNCGKTPAYDVRQWIATKMEQLPLRWPLPSPPNELPERGTVIGAGNRDIMVADSHIIPEEVRPVFGTQGAVLYVYGRISYRDVFGDWHYTNYRLIYGGPHGGRKIQKEGAEWGLLQRHPDGNDAT